MHNRSKNCENAERITINIDRFTIEIQESKEIKEKKKNELIEIFNKLRNSGFYDKEN